MGMFGGKYSLTAHSEKRSWLFWRLKQGNSTVLSWEDYSPLIQEKKKLLGCEAKHLPNSTQKMWRTFSLTLTVVLALGGEVSLTQDVWTEAAVEETLERQQQQNISEISSMLGKTRRQILAAQFECYLRIIKEPKHIEDGPYCNRTWDGWLCWGDSAPGVAVQMCPEYFVDFDPAEKVTKVCNPDGQWFHHPDSNRVWSNYTLCAAHTKENLKLAFSMYYLAMVGHGLSIVSLVISLIIFSYFKSLSCQRISLHKNMFLSYIFNSITTIIWLSLTFANNQAIHGSNPVSCKVLAVLVQYSSTSNYFWMLCQGIYLHTLIIVAVFVGEQQLFWYYILGWGFPVVPALFYAVARGLFYNDRCWISSHTSLVYIIHGPITAALLVNFFFLLNIVRVLITKLRETHCAESTTYMKAVRATLILIPLFGAQYMLLPWRPEGHISRAIYDFFINIFGHFQGLLVAIIFCFCNSEAQAALKRKWAQWKSAWGKAGWGETPITNSHYSYHHNSSITETSRATISLEQPAAATSAQHETSNFLSKEQQKRSSVCSNGEVDMLKEQETTEI